MESSRFATAAFTVGVLVFVQALIIAIGSVYDFRESHPGPTENIANALAGILFPIVFVIFLPEYLLGSLPQRLGFPVVLPALTIILATISYLTRERKQVFSVVALILILVSISFHVAVRHGLDHQGGGKLPPPGAGPGPGMAPPRDVPGGGG